ncbi:MAG: DUF4392 domain-containing protein [Magnetococcales bacterium]|nr:DUF4392 domain-containing protein [Magnetococcales bacterium]
MDNKTEIINKIETIVQEDVGRNIKDLCQAAQGGLHAMAHSLLHAKTPCVGIMTGFFIPDGRPPAGETDGPLGAALLLAGLQKMGIACRLLTDAPCAALCKAALQGAQVTVPIDIISNHFSPEMAKKAWHQAGMTHVLAIERCGKSRDGTYRNMRGEDIRSHTASLDEVFTGGAWVKLAIGDGGNEIGMGSIPREVISRCVAKGAVIASVTPADILLVTGVSNWGGYALLGALAMMHEAWRATVLDVLTIENHDRILKSMVKHGPAVDGVTLKRSMSVDGLPLEKHHAILLKVRKIVE